MHPHLSHGKYLKKKGAVELSWIRPLYCPQLIAILRLVNGSELDLLKKAVEDRYFRIRKYFTRIRIHQLFNPRSDILKNSSYTRNTMGKLMKTTLLSLNWTNHSSLTKMFNLRVCHTQRRTLDLVLHKNNASQVDGALQEMVCSKH